MASGSKSTSALLKPNNNGLQIKSQQAGPSTSSAPTRIKAEVPGTVEMPFPTERLTSFRMPRDLTLGGMGLSATRLAQRPTTANKKVYMPNLNAVRNKNVYVAQRSD